MIYSADILLIGNIGSCRALCGSMLNEVCLLGSQTSKHTPDAVPSTVRFTLTTDLIRPAHEVIWSSLKVYPASSISMASTVIACRRSHDALTGSWFMARSILMVMPASCAQGRHGRVCSGLGMPAHRCCSIHRSEAASTSSMHAHAMTGGHGPAWELWAVRLCKAGIAHRQTVGRSCCVAFSVNVHCLRCTSSRHA